MRQQVGQTANSHAPGQDHSEHHAHDNSCVNRQFEAGRAAERTRCSRRRGSRRHNADNSTGRYAESSIVPSVPSVSVLESWFYGRRRASYRVKNDSMTGRNVPADELLPRNERVGRGKVTSHPGLPPRNRHLVETRLTVEAALVLRRRSSRFAWSAIILASASKPPTVRSCGDCPTSPPSRSAIS